MSTGRALLDRLAHGRESRLVHVHEVPSRTVQCVDWPTWLPDDVRAAYRRLGVEAPWTHQVAAAEVARSGRPVVLATGTASGKSLAFGMPALASIEEGTRAPDGRGATVLYITPTKALAHDQCSALEALDLPWLRVATYDGDTPTDERSWVRQHGNYVLTNPDLLHHSLLPGHRSWAPFLRRLSLVVVDEAHVYRGVLGSHVSAVLRRLRRLARHYGADPAVFLATATIANPGEAAGRLIGSAVVAVTDDGSPRPGLTIGFWEPPLVESGANARRSALAESADLLADCVVEGRQALDFVRSRKGAEATALMTRDLLAEIDPSLVDRVAAYRGGYLPEERRSLESRLRDGSLRALATTSALEMGIDISGLDVVITTGWPGTRASLWQQFGRSGRSANAGLGIFVARDDPLDSYLVHHPGVILDADVEASVFDPGNRYVLGPHLCAAAAELPLTDEALPLEFGPGAPAVADQLASDGMLRRRTGGWFWTRRERASNLTDLRGSGGPAVRVVEDGTGRLLGTVDPAAAPGSVHPGAVYLHRGVSHVVTGLDLDDAVATVVEEEVDYTTVSSSVSELVILEVDETRELGAATLCLGSVDVSSQVVSFQRRRPTGEVLGVQPLDLPVRRLLTRAVWWTLTEQSLTDAGVPGDEIAGAAHAAEHAAIGILPLFATCDRWDLGGVSTDRHPDTGRPTVFVYDGYPGGAGFAEHGFRVAREWLTATRATIAECGCEEGCPSCIQSPKCGNGNNPLNKAHAVRLLDVVVASTRGQSVDRPG